MSKVISHKLITGEEIIATASSNSIFIVSKVRAIGMQQGPQGQVGVALYPWMLSSGDSQVEINDEHVVASIEEDKIPSELVKTYIQQTSGLVMAGASSVASLKK